MVRLGKGLEAFLYRSMVLKFTPFKSGDKGFENLRLSLTMQSREVSSPRVCWAAERRALRALIRSHGKSIDSTSSRCKSALHTAAGSQGAVSPGAGENVRNVNRRRFDTVSAVPHMNIWRLTNSGGRS